VDCADDLGVVDAVEMDRRDAEVGEAELALDDGSSTRAWTHGSSCSLCRRRHKEQLQPWLDMRRELLSVRCCA
jgi:hypothetical protein